jgi:hypothetical protein
VEKHDEFVTWRGFVCDGSTLERGMPFQFTRQNYNAVVSAIVNEASSEKKKDRDRL